jgi:acyl-CoA synthetase (AMP-forming)/AMP-acid ligase II/acyl carrier protein
VATLREHSISVLQVVPSLLEALLEHPGFPGSARLRLVLCGAEPLSSDTAARTRARTAAELVNLYGPTETTISSTFFRYSGDASLPQLPIGRPIANTTVAVVDGAGEPVPIGVAGELLVAGAGVARGYLHDPERTAAKFAPSTATRGARCYRTGDRVRYLPDGTLAFLGRCDMQVKIRGVRVEPGEIEATLAAQTKLRGAAVEWRGESRRSGGRLVAYVVGRTGEHIDPSVLRDHLRARLPEAMIPADFVVLADWPLTASGKLDRHQLRAPETGASSASEFIAPRDPFEARVAEVFEDVLERRPVGARDHFFDLGGHSLSAMQLVTRIGARFGVDVPMRVVFATPTVEGIARFVGAATGGTNASPARGDAAPRTVGGGGRMGRPRGG